jgi:hypothetical protein
VAWLVALVGPCCAARQQEVDVVEQVRRLNDEAEKQLRDGRYGAGIVPAQRAVELSE